MVDQQIFNGIFYGLPDRSALLSGGNLGQRFEYLDHSHMAGMFSPAGFEPVIWPHIGRFGFAVVKSLDGGDPFQSFLYPGVSGIAEFQKKPQNISRQAGDNPAVPAPVFCLSLVGKATAFVIL